MIRILAAVAAFCLAIHSGAARAATDINVTTTAVVVAADGQCSLREAILAATAGATRHDCVVGGGGAPYRIVLQAGQVHTITAADPFDSHPQWGQSWYWTSVGEFIEIIGNGAVIARDAAAAKFRFMLVSAADVTLRDVVLRGFDVTGSGADWTDGGAIVASDIGTLNVDRVTFENNKASYGGAIYVSYSSIANIVGSTFKGTFGLGAAAAGETGSMNIANSTFSGNGTDVMMLQYGNGSLSLSHNTFGNVFAFLGEGTAIARGNIFYDCFIGFTEPTGSNNVGPGGCPGRIGGYPSLQPLADNGGDTLTRGFTAPSPLQDANPTCTFVSMGANSLFTNGAAITTDQRGAPRAPGACDVGAYEHGAPSLVALPQAPQGVPYHAPLAGTGGTGPYTFELMSGPAWIYLDTSGGHTLRGIPPSGHGTTIQLVVRVADSTGRASYGTYDLFIANGVPSAPAYAGSSVDGSGNATVHYTASADDGGSPILGYKVICTTGLNSPDGMTSPLTFTVASGSTNFNCRVHARNANGHGPGSESTFALSADYAVVTTLIPATSGYYPPDDRVGWFLQFNRPVGNLAKEDFVLTTTGTITGAVVVGAVSLSGDPTDTTWIVEAYTGTSGYGTLKVDFIDRDLVFDSNLVPVAGYGIGDGNFESTGVHTIAVVPGAPTISSIVPGNGNVEVSFSPPASNGGLAITGYQATCNAGGLTSPTSLVSPLVVPVVNGQSYTCTVRATNPVGTSVPSASAPVTVPTVSVSGIFRASANPATPGTVLFTVVFSYPVTGVDAGDFTLATTGMTGASITNVTGSGATYTVTVHTGTGSGTVRLDLVDNDTINDGSAPLFGVGTGAVTNGDTYNIISVPGAPTITSITPSSGQLGIAFSPPGSDGGSAITGYQVTCNPGSLTSASSLTSPLTVSVVNGVEYSCTARATNAAGAGPASAPMNATAPAVTVVSINRASPNPDGPGNVLYTVTFSQGVTGVDSSDFTLATTGVTGASIVNVNGAGSSYTVTVNTGTGAGTVRLDLVDDDSIADASTGKLNGVGTGGVTNGETFTIGGPPGAPTITSIVPGNGQASVAFTPPSSDGGLPITGYQAICNPGSVGSSTALDSPLVVSPLARGRVYSCTVTAYNAAGPGAASAPMDVKLPKPEVDFNADGKGDLTWKNGAGTHGIWLMDGNNTPTTAAHFVAAGTLMHRLGDFNGDGMTDVLWRTAAGGYEVSIMNGTVIVSTTTLLGGGTGWENIARGDFNGDGKDDLVWRRTSDGLYGMWLMNGGAIASAHALASPGPAYTLLKVGDFDGDGKGDLLWRATDGTVVIQIMDGATVSSSGTTAVSTAWTFLDVGDFNADGKTDTLWRHTSNLHGVWLMNGAAISSAVATFGPTGSQIHLVGDFDGNGRSDLLWRGPAGNYHLTLLSGNAVVGAATEIFAGGGGWEVEDKGDYNGDGKDDLLWRNSGASYGTWLVDGTTITSYKVILGAGSGWEAYP